MMAVRFLAWCTVWVGPLVFAGWVHAQQQPVAYLEPPYFADDVGRGILPPISERVPQEPSVVQVTGPARTMGRHGGDLRLLMGKAKDVRLMVVYGYARLLGYTERFDIEADILKDVEVQRSQVFTLRLRKGHRWSDGHPFTSEAFRYYWEDIALNPDLSPFGPPRELLVDGKPPRVEFVDDVTVRFTWESPNPFFLPALAGTRPLTIYSPGHYLQQFHQRYADPQTLAERVAAAGVRNWAALHNRMDRPYKNDNPSLPTLQPWVNTTAGPSERFVFTRNPYYYRVDDAGRQLPYIDRVLMHIADGKLIAAKTGAGESDLQARHLKFSDYTFLKQGEKRNGTVVRLWSTTKGAHIALFPNLNVEDTTWRILIRDVRFRRALSLAIDRHEINQVLYYGLGIEGNNSVHVQCPLYRDEYRTAWASFDLVQANALLDELGLGKRDARGLRLLPDGRPMVIVVETAGEDTEQSDVLELIHDSWLKAGIKLFTKPMQREVFRNRIFSGKTLVSVWGGLENGLPTANISPDGLAPTSQQQLQWPKWGQYYETNGKAGAPVDLPQAEALLRLNDRWRVSPEFKEREAIWHRMLHIYTDQVFTIGLVAGVPQPVVVNRRLRSVPVKGIYNWEPGAHFGIYRPDTFWFAE